MKQILLLIKILLLYSVCANGQGFINGDFANGFKNCTGAPSWRSNGDVQLAEIYQPGNLWLDITGCASGNGNWIEQDVSVEIGKTYFIQLDLGTWEGWDDMDAGVSITIDNVVLGQRIFHDSFTHSMDIRLQWMTRTSCPFTPTKDKVTIRITGNSVCTKSSPQTSCDKPMPGVIAVDNIILKELEVKVQPKICIKNGKAKIKFETTGFVPKHTFEWWKDGVFFGKDSAFDASLPGTYTIKVDFICHQMEKSIEVISTSPTQVSKTICRNQVMSINGKKIYTSGIYKDTFINSGGCDSVVIYDIKIKTAARVPVPQKYFLCNDNSDTVVLIPGSTGTIKWIPDGDTNRFKQVGMSGRYYYTVTYDSVCIDTGLIDVYNICDPPDFTPNAFSPNGDGSNELFMPVIRSGYKYRLEIYNRWGEKLYDSEDTGKGWDGRYKGEICAQGVYLYILSYTNIDTKRAYYSDGTFTLLR